MGGLNVDLLNMIIMQKVLRFLIHYIQTSFCHITQHHSRTLVDNNFSKNIENGLITPHKKHDS